MSALKVSKCCLSMSQSFASLSLRRQSVDVEKATTENEGAQRLQAAKD